MSFRIPPLFATLALAVSPLLTPLMSPAAAQELPPQIRLVVPFAAGATADQLARAVAAELGKRTGKSVYVENLPGASTFIGAAAAAKGAKDGSVLFITTSSTITASVSRREVPVDITTDMLPVSLLSEGPMVLLTTPTKNLLTPKDLLAAARKDPDMLTIGTGGLGSAAHLAGELLNDAAKIQLKHIPYRSAALVVPDFMAGRIDVMIGNYSSFAAQVKAGRGHLVAVTSETAHPALPGVPPLSSVVPGYSVINWYGFFTPVGTPRAIVQRLNRELNEIAKSKAIVDLVEPDAQSSRALTPEEFGAFVKKSHADWKKIAMEKNIVAE